MKKLIIGILLLWAVMGILFAQESGHIVLNPLTGDLEYVTNPYAIGDSLVNLGYDNNIDHATLSTMIGFGNYLGSPDCVSVGWDNSVNCTQNFSLGKNIQCNAEKVIMIGMSPYLNVEARMPGSIAFCPGGGYGTMYVHSGYTQANNTYSGNIGGVRIGRGTAYTDGNIALEVIGSYPGFEDSPATSKIINTGNGEWVVDPDEMTLTGSVEVGYLESPYTPKVHSAAADTSLLPTPLKIGDYFIDTSARDVYISTGTARGTWKKVN